MSKIIEYKLGKIKYIMDCNDFNVLDLNDFFFPLQEYYSQCRNDLLVCFFGKKYTKQNEERIDGFFPLNMMITAYKYSLYHDKFQQLTTLQKVKEFKKFCENKPSLYPFKEHYDADVELGDILDALIVFSKLKKRVVDNPADILTYGEEVMELGFIQEQVSEFAFKKNIFGEGFAEYAYKAIYYYNKNVSNAALEEDMSVAEIIGYLDDPGDESDSDG